MLELQHNVVNILHAMKGMVETHLSKVNEGHFQNSDDALTDSRSVMESIHKQALRAVEITKRIGLAMKAQRNPDEPLSEIPLKPVWEECVEILKNRYSFDRLEVIEHIPSNYPPIQCIRKDLLEILYTLSQNAIQAMRRNGKLIIRAHIQFSGERPVAVLSLSDTGPGMSEEILSRLFEPFFTTKSFTEGNGLGLCLVKSLVKKNGGGVGVTSFKGCGTTFTISFQTARQKAAEVSNTLAMAG